MAVSKSDFLNYTRCPRFVALAELRKEKLDADLSYAEYQEQERLEQIQEILGNMFEDETYEHDLTQKVNAQLEALMPFYKQVEIEAGGLANKYFGGKSKYAAATKNQECFEFNQKGIKYVCYVDIYNENKQGINIIEVKATTSNKYLKLLGSFPKKEKYPIFYFNVDKNTYFLKDEIDYPLNQEMPDEVFAKNKAKLFDRYTDVGKYVYDLAVQRYIIEGEYRSSGNAAALENIHYYLAILNHEYVFDGSYIDGVADYKKDAAGHELIVFIDLTKVTAEYQKIIAEDEARLEKYIFALDGSPVPMGIWCERKKMRECPFLAPICGKDIPAKNSALNYLNNGFGFKNEDNERLKGLDLINHGYLEMLDIPEEWITNPKHHIQRDAVRFGKEYIDKEKIAAGLSLIEYPIYHLDFETMPCPLPRFRGEKPYMQSPFEFSLHIETEPGKCDKLKDNYIFLAKTNTEDEREELVKKLIEYIDGDKGTLFAQNVSFEKGRIKELAAIFPEYRERLMKIYDRGFDLMWLVNTNAKLYEELGFDKKRSALPNYYHKDLSGSYSIKKTLPVFSDLSYANLEVKNGTEAIVAYANYNKMTKEEYQLMYQALIEYCRQDTWAMVVILEALRHICQ